MGTSRYTNPFLNNECTFNLFISPNCIVSTHQWDSIWILPAAVGPLTINVSITACSSASHSLLSLIIQIIINRLTLISASETNPTQTVHQCGMSMENAVDGRSWSTPMSSFFHIHSCYRITSHNGILRLTRMLDLHFSINSTSFVSFRVRRLQPLTQLVGHPKEWQLTIQKSH